MNKDTFKQLVEYIKQPSSEVPDDTIYSARYSLNYTYDYAPALVQYYRAMGCTIVRTNWNTWDGGFYIYYTAPTKTVDTDVFLSTYKHGTHYDTRTLNMFKFVGVIIGIQVLVGLLVCIYRGLT